MKLNTLFDVAFSLVHEGEPEDVPVERLIAAARARLDLLEQNMEDACDAFSVNDSHEESDEQKDAYVSEKYPYEKI